MADKYRRDKDGKALGKKKAKGNGSGTIYARKNKDGKITSYRGEYRIDGKAHYVSHKNKGECEKLLRAAMVDADRGLVSEATTTVEQYLNSWLPGIKHGKAQDVGAVRADNTQAPNPRAGEGQAEGPQACPNSCALPGQARRGAFGAYGPIHPYHPT